MGEQNEVLAAEIKALKDEIKTLKENIVELFSRINVVERVTDVVNEKLGNIKDSQKEIKDTILALTLKVESIMQAPGKRWDSTINTIITVIVTGTIAYFIGKMTGGK